MPPGGSTTAHYHVESEELYFFTSGRGRLRVAGEWREVGPGDCAVLPPPRPGADLGCGGPHWEAQRKEHWRSR